ncbi:hypothetical protein ACWEKT_20180 [Nocardia takedensis]|uniref:hypothetical protein n=1 Tax=Nocardia takedensis TaxID=259390 RepID=UPI0005933FD0|nr:hypothetical protein [Nocardia takedensis]
MAVKIITLDEFHDDYRHQYAGTVHDLMPSTVENWKTACPTWAKWHWQIGLVAGSGTCLYPVNVVTG